MDVKLPDGPMMVNRYGAYVPVSLIRPDVILQDQTVRALVERAQGMQAQLAAFREAAFSDADAFLEVLSEKYGAKPRSASNTSLESFDGTLKVEISTGSFLTLGPEIHAAKSLIDECLTEWSQGSNDNLRAIVNQAFAVGEGGKLRIDRILALKQVEIADAKWQRAMKAIGDAVRATHSKRYIRFHVRENADAPWRQVSLDMARLG